MNGKRKLGDGLKYGLRSFATQPLSFTASSQFKLVLGLYFSTYAVANVIDTTCEQYGVDQSTSSWYKFLGTTVANMGLCIYKDQQFTRMFGVSASRALPKLSYFLFAARDSLTIAASFNAPSLVADWLQKNDWISNRKTATVVAQLVSPAAVQFISTPVHLYALDLYNRPEANKLQRTQLIRKEYLKSAFARIARIGPAFGIGGVSNIYFRGFRNDV